jgi:hypothetical protein
MKAVTRTLDVLLPILGVLIIVAALLPDLPSRSLGAVIIGTLLIQAGLSKLAHRFMPEERQFLALRTEGDLFLTLMRSLNAAGVALKHSDTEENRQEFEQVRQAMLDCVQRMSGVAGKTFRQIAAEAGEPDAELMWKNDFFGSPAGLVPPARDAGRPRDAGTGRGS